MVRRKRIKVRITDARGKYWKTLYFGNIREARNFKRHIEKIRKSKKVTATITR